MQPLQSPAFIGLEDFSLPLEAEPQGRSNPFAPLGATTTTVVTPAQVVPAQTGASMKTMTQ